MQLTITETQTLYSSVSVHNSQQQINFDPWQWNPHFSVTETIFSGRRLVEFAAEGKEIDA